MYTYIISVTFYCGCWIHKVIIILRFKLIYTIYINHVYQPMIPVLIAILFIYLFKKKHNCMKMINYILKK